jgi:hypothetical protein
MKRFLIALIPLPFLFLSDAQAAEVGLLQILTGFSAKEGCSCAFVVEQTDAYCTEFAQPPGFKVDVAIDRAQKTLTASYIGMSRTARFTDSAGCVLDSL